MLPLGPNAAELSYVRPARVAARPELLARYRQLLSETELARTARFVFERDRLTQLVARALVRATLSRHAPEVAADAWRFGEGSHGKPFIAGPDPACELRFNLTHTRGLVALLVTVGRDVGLDAEDAAREGTHLDHPEHFFAPAELDGLRELEGEAFRRRFYELWTLKEAYIKARGLGLSLPLDRFAFALGDGPPRLSFSPPIVDQPSRWQLWQGRLGEHQLAAAIDRVGLDGGRGADLEIILRQTVPLED